VNFHEVYPSKEALEEALQGSAAALPEQLEQLDELLSSIGASSAGRETRLGGTSALGK
jgi:hypothetical protein